MYFVDTHTHIFLEEFDEDIDRVLERAFMSEVRHFCLPNVDESTIGRLHRLCDAHPSCCHPMMGLHPTSVQASFGQELESIRNWLGKRAYIAIGEIGIDLYWDQTFVKEQMAVFEEQLRWSIDLNLPVVIHNRDAFPQVMECLHKVGADRLRGIFHSFGGSREELEEILRCKNFLIGINGVVTFKNSTFRNYLNEAPLERIVLETDAPYLSPVPFRGKRNEPSYIIKTAEKLAEIYNLPMEEIARKTTENALQLFDL